METKHDGLAEQFEKQRPHLQAVAFRMLGSMSEADDAVQEGWLHLSRSDAAAIENMGGWLTTTVARICLDMLRSRKSRREEPFDADLAGPLLDIDDTTDPEQGAVLADSVGLALLVVLETLSPAERLAFVLHDMFAVPFEEIGNIIGKSTLAARQLASRARRRVRGVATVADEDFVPQREVVSAFLAAAHNGDFTALLTILDPDIKVRADATARSLGAQREVRGATAVLGTFLGRAQAARLALVDGKVGMVWAKEGQVRVVFDLTIRDGRIAEINLIADHDRLSEMHWIILES